jgi:hypothetical protein
MSDQMKELQGYVNDMLTVEVELHEALRRQKKDHDGLRNFGTAHQIVARAEDTVDRHLATLRESLKRLGGDESTLKKAVGGILGAAAGVYDKLRADSTVSRLLRDDYTALSFATVCYEMLHTTALAMKDQVTADLALRHLKDYAPLIMALTEAMPEVLVEELANAGTVTADRSVATDAVRNTREAWASASNHA